MSYIVTSRRRNLKHGKICKDCNRIITNESKGMKCLICGEWVCYKCNITYKCKSCYVDDRNDYYVDEPIDGGGNK